MGREAAPASPATTTSSLEKAVENHLREAGTAAALFLAPNRKLGPDCLRSPGDVATLARGAKAHLRAFVAEHAARRLLLFYCGPLSGACFLGHRLKAVAPEILVMEDQKPGYAPAFLLR